LDVVEGRPQGRQQLLSGIRRCHAARRSREQPDTDALVQAANRVAHGRKGDAQSFRRPGEVPLIGDDRERR
jgi:hypothetical protein